MCQNWLPYPYATFGIYMQCWDTGFACVYSIIRTTLYFRKMGESDEKIKLYVGSLPFDTRGPDLKEMFSKYGTPYNGKWKIRLITLSWLVSYLAKCLVVFHNCHKGWNTKHIADTKGNNKNLCCKAFSVSCVNFIDCASANASQRAENQHMVTKWLERQEMRENNIFFQHFVWKAWNLEFTCVFQGSDKIRQSGEKTPI